MNPSMRVSFYFFENLEYKISTISVYVKFNFKFRVLYKWGEMKQPYKTDLKSVLHKGA